MNKPKIRKSLFIGLGGTGASTLLALKKRFFEVYGHIDNKMVCHDSLNFWPLIRTHREPEN